MTLEYKMVFISILGTSTVHTNNVLKTTASLHRNKCYLQCVTTNICKLNRHINKYTPR